MDRRSQPAGTKDAQSFTHRSANASVLAPVSPWLHTADMGGRGKLLLPKRFTFSYLLSYLTYCPCVSGCTTRAEPAW